MDNLVAQKVDNFFKKFKKQLYKKGEILINAEEPPAGIFYLLSGAIKEYAISNKGEELVVNVFKPMSFFPMSFAVNKTPNEYYFEALEDVEIYKAPVGETVEFIKNNPDVLFDLMSRVYKGVDGMLNRMVNLMSGEAYSRVVTELIIAAKRFGRKVGQEVELDLSEKDLANQAGMARETVSREIRILKDKGLVDFNHNVLKIRSMDLLEKEV